VNENNTKETLEALRPWLTKELDTATGVLIERGVFDTDLIEARPAWVLPRQILIGQARPHGREADTVWFISGEVPFDAVPGSVASVPRDAARHFAMKWQLEAEKLEGDAATDLIEIAESLYALADDERLWDRS
jgi:hypothetical protein